MSAAQWHWADELIDRCFAVDPAVHYVAVYLHGDSMTANEVGGLHERREDLRVRP